MRKMKGKVSGIAVVIALGIFAVFGLLAYNMMGEGGTFEIIPGQTPGSCDLPSAPSLSS